MTTTTADPHTIAQATDAFSDAWAAVYIDVAEKLEAEERQAQTGHTPLELARCITACVRSPQRSSPIRMACRFPRLSLC